MDFTIPRETAKLRDQIAAFVDTHLIPREADPASYDEHENIALPRLAAMRDKALVDGADEVLKMLLNRHLSEQGPAFWSRDTDA